MIVIPAPGYEVRLGRGLIDRLGALLPPRRSFIVTDEKVASAGWPARAATALGDAVIGIHVLASGENNKNLICIEELIDRLLEAGVERGDRIVAVGGGLVVDMAGFAAAIVKRGCGFVPVPTSLLAQADAAIGGKTGINARQGKNLIGAFHRPSSVVIDFETLKTVPARELRGGYAEVVKYGLIGDAAFFEWCEGHAEVLLAGDDAARQHAIETSVRAKIAIVAQDERDHDGRRALLNFGHSFAHAIEAETGMPHGEAVALGMTLAFRLSVDRRLCPDADAERVAAHLDAVGLPTRLKSGDPRQLAARMAHDKKRAGGRTRLVLARGIGETLLDDTIELAEIEAFLERERSAGFAIG
jgi:3-dehydroquinate synthase